MLLVYQPAKYPLEFPNQAVGQKFDPPPGNPPTVLDFVNHRMRFLIRSLPRCSHMLLECTCSLNPELDVASLFLPLKDDHIYFVVDFMH